jgi:thiosulfate/3-mercaptopyruvate sulfurtransferase
MNRRYLIIALTTILSAVVSGVLASGEPATTLTNETTITSAEEILAAGAFNYANPDALVDTEWVLDNLENNEVRFIDVSNNKDAFERGHLPGAIFIDWKAELTNPDDSTEGQILTAEQFEVLLSERGIANDHTVVVYDNTSNLFSSRAYWVFAYYNHENVKLYNGGTLAWEADGQKLTRDAASYEPTEYVAGEINEDVRANYGRVLASLDDENVVTCDTRSDGEYDGSDARADQGGHIPGAIHLEWTHAVTDDGRFKPAPELAALFYAEGFTPDKEILTYCQTGVRGAHTWFVLSELLGYPNVRNYDGSWAEWGNTPDAPISQ